MKLSIKEAAKEIGCSEQFMRVALQQGKYPFGVAIKETGRKWTYHISRERLELWKKGAL